MVGIKDFEMPKWCGECRMCIEETTMDDVSTYCAILNQDITWNGNRVDNCPLVEAIPKSDYENRLKADMVAMLTELQLEIEEYQYEDKYDAVNDDMTGWILAVEANKFIQQKINSLKENENGNK